MEAGFAELGARSNFILLDGASHPHEFMAQAKLLGHAGISICDINSLAGSVRTHVAAREIGLRAIVGTRLILEDGAAYLAWPVNRAGYGHLTRLLSHGRMSGPKGACRITRRDMLTDAEAWVMAAIPPLLPDVRLHRPHAGGCGRAARTAGPAAVLRRPCPAGRS